MSARRGVIALMTIVCAFGIAVGVAPARAAIRTRPDELPVTNGTVEAVARSADRIYLGGNFTRVLPRVGPFAIVSPASGQMTGEAPEVSGGRAEVDSVVGDGDGGFYIGGSFTHVAGVVRHDVAHVLADGSLDPAWNPDVAGEVLAIARLGSSVYLGGTFHGAGAINGDVSRNYLAAVDAKTGQATGWAPEPDEYVIALAAAESTVYFSGAFNHVGATARHFAAAVDATSGAVTGWNPEPVGGVLAIAVAGSSVYLGGDFVSLGGTPAGRLGRVDATTGATQLFGPTGVNGPVWTLAVSGSTLYLGGQFTTVGGATRDDAAAVNLLGVVQPWDPSIPNVFKLNSLVVAGASVYLGGSFSAVNGTAERNFLAAVDPTSGALTGWNPDATGTVNALAVSGGSIGAGGTFTSLGPGVPRHNLAAFSAADGSVLPWAPEPDHPVHAILPDGPQVYVGGYFDTIGDRARPGLAAIDAATGVATGFSAQVSGLGAEVNAMQLVGPTLYIGGDFEKLNGNVTRNNAAAVDTTSGLVTPFDPNVNNRVTALLVSGSTAYLAGPNLTRVGGVAPSGTAREGVAAVAADTGAVLPWDAKADGGVFALAGSGSTIYLGGSFSTVDGLPRAGAATVDATTALPSGWDMHLSEFAVVKALAVSGSEVYAGGTVVGLAAVDGASGAPVGWNPVPTIATEVLALATDGAGGVLAGGTFRSFEESPQATVASFSALPESIAAPAVSGTAAVGQTLSCSEGTWAGSVPQSHAYAWLRDGAPIDGATGPRYDLARDDGGHQLRCRVTAANLAGAATATSDPLDVAVPPASPPGGTRATPRAKPVVSGLKLAPSSFRAAKRGGSVVPKGYAAVSYRLSDPATVTFGVQRPAAGRRRGKSCVKPTPKLRKAKAKKCTRFVAVPGSFARSRAAGADRFHFSGRFGGRTLRPGPYRLTAVAAGSGGARSEPALSAFRILAPKHRRAGGARHARP
jgi:hypothetical protein